MAMLAVATTAARSITSYFTTKIRSIGTKNALIMPIGAITQTRAFQGHDRKNPACPQIEKKKTIVHRAEIPRTACLSPDFLYDNSIGIKNALTRPTVAINHR